MTAISSYYPRTFFLVFFLKYLKYGQNKYVHDLFQYLVAHAVTLVVAFALFLNFLWRCQGPMNGILPFYGCRLSSENTQRCGGSYLLQLNSFGLFPLRGGGNTETSFLHPMNHQAKRSLPNILIVPWDIPLLGTCFLTTGHGIQA